MKMNKKIVIIFIVLIILSISVAFILCKKEKRIEPIELSDISINVLKEYDMYHDRIFGIATGKYNTSNYPNQFYLGFDSNKIDQNMKNYIINGLLYKDETLTRSDSSISCPSKKCGIINTEKLNSKLKELYNFDFTISENKQIYYENDNYVYVFEDEVGTLPANNYYISEKIENDTLEITEIFAINSDNFYNLSDDGNLNKISEKVEIKELKKYLNKFNKYKIIFIKSNGKYILKNIKKIN